MNTVKYCRLYNKIDQSVLINDRVFVKDIKMVMSGSDGSMTGPGRRILGPSPGARICRAGHRGQSGPR